MKIYRQGLLGILTILLSYSSIAHSQNSFCSKWQARATQTQAEQPRWVTPLVTVTPRLEQEFRTDFVRQITSQGDPLWNFGNGKGLELIPQRNIELLINFPPYLQHNSSAKDGFGDFTMTAKYRILASNENKRNFILTAFVGGAIPTGSYKNGSTDATITPTLAGGKGWRRLDAQSTLGAILPVANAKALGRPITWNTALQYRVEPRVWPEVEFNSTYYKGGPNDGKAQTFLTPGIVTRFHLHERLGLTFGAGMQIAISSFHSYNHALVFSARMPF